MKFNYKKEPPATTRAWLQLLTPPKFECFTCARGSYTETEHLTHVCDPFRVWVLHTWRRIRVFFGLWSWAPTFPDNYAGNVYNDGQNTAMALPPFEECGACRNFDPNCPNCPEQHDASCTRLTANTKA